MSYYYIENFDDNTVNLVSVKIYEQDINLARENLQVFSKDNIVVGYNRLTGEIKRTTIKDVLNLINSKLHLISGGTTSSLEVKKLSDLCVNVNGYSKAFDSDKQVFITNVKYEVHSYDYQEGIATIRLYTDDATGEVCSIQFIDWDYIFESICEEVSLALPEVKIRLLFDFKLVECVICSCMTDWSEEVITITDIKFTDKFDMSATKICQGLFYFKALRVSEENPRNLMITDNCVIDLSKYNAENLENLYYMFRGFRGKIKYPKFRNITNSTLLISDRILTKDEVEELYNKVLVHTSKDTFIGETIMNTTITQITAEYYFKLLPYMNNYRNNVTINELIVEDNNKGYSNNETGSFGFNTVRVKSFTIKKGFVADKDYHFS